jgi:predicted PurR-regulated permease PerM
MRDNAIAARRDLRQPMLVLAMTVLSVAVIALLYWAQAVIIPLALAVLLTFVLGPAVTALQRWGIGRAPAVILVVAGAVGIVVSVAGLISWQTAALVQELPNHRDRIRAKLETVQQWAGGDSDGRLSAFVKDIEKALDREDKPTVAVPVEMVERPTGWMNRLQASIGPVANGSVKVAYTIVLIAFLLYGREKMRNRVLRLLGPTRLAATTKAIDDAGVRISRYLRVQLLLNAAFGVALTIALLALDVRFAILWGFAAAILRYIPYIGAWIGLIPPLLASLAMTDNWWQPLCVLGVYAALEFVVANIAEPYFFGQSLGLSEVALIVSAGFWAFMWGPIGMIMSGPITAVLLVVAKHVPQLHSLGVLLGDEDALSPPMAFFQRLAARDRDEAWRIAGQYQSDRAPGALADGLFLPAMALAQGAVDRRELSDEDGQWIEGAMREIADDLSEPPPAEEPKLAEVEPARLLSVPAGGLGDALALELLERRLPAQRWEMQHLHDGALASEMLAAVREFKPAVVVLGTLASGDLAHARYLCKRLVATDPDIKLFVGRWGHGPIPSALKSELPAVGVDEVAADLAGMHKLLESWWASLAAPAQDRSEMHEPVGTASAS